MFSQFFARLTGGKPKKSDEIHHVREPADYRRDLNLRQTARGLTNWLAASVLLITVFVLPLPWTTGLRTWSLSLLLGAASASAGILLGFLFGIPRSLQTDAGRQPVPISGSTNAARPSNVTVNTNLEQISDWLTKILVGVGLTQLNNIVPRLWQVAVRVAPTTGDTPVVSLAIIIDFTIWGFFVGYLLTRLFLSGAFSLADSASEFLSEKERVGYQLTKQGNYSAAAAEYSAAIERITPDTPPQQRRAIYEGAMYSLLYADNFLDVIRHGRAYLADPTNPSSGRVLAYLAMGYGQQFDAERHSGATPEALTSIRSNALGATKNAVTIEPGIKSLLRMVWDPNDPTKLSVAENDLEVFFPEEEFRRLLD